MAEVDRWHGALDATIEVSMTHDEKVDNAVRFLAVLVRPEHRWLVKAVADELARLRKERR